jgi:hypothetical protein
LGIVEIATSLADRRHGKINSGEANDEKDALAEWARRRYTAGRQSFVTP